MNNPHSRKRFTLLAAFSLAAFIAASLILVSVGAPSAVAQTGPYSITLASMKGPWALSLGGFTGCGHQTLYVTFTLNGQGQGTADIKYHGDCGDGDTPNVPFVIQTLNPDGSGTANLSCGPGCGWNLIIQVERFSQSFTAIDVDPVNPGNFISGTAIRVNRP
jgi:hypothetical protein